MTNIVAIGAAILFCVNDPKKDQCPYLPLDDHAHEEIYIPIEIQTTMNVVATSASVISDSSIIHSYPDPDRDGSVIYFFYKIDF